MGVRRSFLFSLSVWWWCRCPAPQQPSLIAVCAIKCPSVFSAAAAATRMRYFSHLLASIPRDPQIRYVSNPLRIYRRKGGGRKKFSYSAHRQPIIPPFYIVSVSALLSFLKCKKKKKKKEFEIHIKWCTRERSNFSFHKSLIKMPFFFVALT